VPNMGSGALPSPKWKGSLAPSSVTGRVKGRHAVRANRRAWWKNKTGREVMASTSGNAKKGKRKNMYIR
jgi:hypothetical protein